MYLIGNGIIMEFTFEFMMHIFKLSSIICQLVSLRDMGSGLNHSLVTNCSCTTLMNGMNAIIPCTIWGK